MKIKKMLTKRWKILLKASEQLTVIAENHRRITESKLKTIQDIIDFQKRTTDLLNKLEEKSGIKPP